MISTVITQAICNDLPVWKLAVLYKINKYKKRTAQKMYGGKVKN